MSGWTKTPPTQPGWYWAISSSAILGRRPPTVVRVEFYDKRRGLLHARCMGDPDGEGATLDVFDLWSGPIEAPPVHS